jgi:hypothetical protein
MRFVALALGLLGIAIAAAPADARPKGLSDGSGCTAAQIQKWGNSGAGKACLDANESGQLEVAQTLYCSSDGAILCCTGAGNDRSECTVIGHETTHPGSGSTNFSHLPSGLAHP